MFEIRANANNKRMICPRCNIEKVLGKAIEPYRDEYAIYIAPLPSITADKLKLVDVYKCPKCGHSEKVNNET